MPAEPDPVTPERIERLLAFGLATEAEALLRQSGPTEAWARGRFLEILLCRGGATEALEWLEGWGGATALPEGALFTRGMLWERVRDWDAAEEGHALSASREPLLSDYASYRAGLCAENDGRLHDASSHYRRAAQSARNGNLKAECWWKVATIAAHRDRPAEALDALERIPRRSVIGRSRLLELESDCHRAMGDRAREARALRALIDSRVGEHEAVLAAIHRLPRLEELSAADRVLLAESALRAKTPADAERQARRALRELRRNPDAVVEGRARLLVGQSLAARKRYTAARRELKHLPPGALADDRAQAAVEQARCLWRLGRIDEALREYDRVASGSGPVEIRATAAWEAAREARDHARWTNAAQRFAQFHEEFPRHEYADDALWHRGRVLYEGGRREEALAPWAELVTTHAGSPYLEEAIYWQARIHREAGRDSTACETLRGLVSRSPDSYWSLRTRESGPGEECGPLIASHSPRSPREWVRIRLGEDSPESWDRAAEAVRKSESFRRARALAARGLPGEAEQELEQIRATYSRSPEGLLAFAEAAQSIGVSRPAIRAAADLKALVGTSLFEGDFPTGLLRLLYPIDHLDSVLRWAHEYDLDPLFLYAVMREESRFDSDAVSWAGARGLLQIMPSTGRDLARRVGVRNFDRTDLFRPDLNIRLGAFYLRSLLDQLDQESALALSAYNAGKRNAVRWRDRVAGEFDVDRYVVAITYRETFRYVQKVARSWEVYRAAYGPQGSSLDAISDGR
jgi:soluble lytic murein transglycosylase